MGAVFEVQSGLNEVAGGDVSVQAGFFDADEEDQAEGVGIGEAGLAGFDKDLERGIVLDPKALGVVEVGVEGVHGIFDF